MQPIYEQMEKDGKIGPKVKGPDGKLVFKPFSEYPKQITTKGGKRVRVNSLVEEMNLVGDMTPSKQKLKDDPLAKQKQALQEQAEALAKQKKELEEMAEKMKATLAEVQADRAVKATETKPAETMAVETVTSTKT